MAGDPDLVIELIGGADYPAEIMCAALHRGAHVVTANKAALASHFDALHACAKAGGATLSYAAAVGGGTPILETLERLVDDGAVVEIEGVLNGTANFLLDRLSEGWAFEDAVAKAQELGFAEEDPAADVDGHDAADKLSGLAREAFGVAVPPRFIVKQSLRDVAAGEPQAALARGEVLKQVGRCRLREDGSIEAEVRIEALRRPPACGARSENHSSHRSQGASNLNGKGPAAGRPQPQCSPRDGPAAQPRRRAGEGRNARFADGVNMA